jgi:L-alanine-DL-glutamate epimerase-like enolase superfamily enzyme
VKISDIEAYDLVIPYDVALQPAWAPGTLVNSRDMTLVLVHTDSGIVGYGAGNGHQTEKILKSVKPLLIGQSPFDIQKYIRILKIAGGTWSVELALWDICGKAATLPLYKMWGAARDKIPAYASTFEVGTPQDRAEQALRYMEEGFKAVKIRLHANTIQEDLAYVDAVKNAVGNRMEIMVDANQPTDNVLSFEPGPKWDYRRALKTALELQAREVIWLEEPLGRWQLNDLASITEKMTTLYIAGGEHNAPLHEFLWLMENHSLDIFQPDVVYESLTQVRKVMTLCEAFNVHFIPHHAICGIGLAATLHLLCTHLGWTYAEYMYDPPQRTIENYQCMGGIITTPLKIDSEGYLSPPDTPGLGISIDMDRAKKYLA